jgi:hypothetical protein
MHMARIETKDKVSVEYERHQRDANKVDCNKARMKERQRDRETEDVKHSPL